ncbi:MULTISPECIES: HAD family hydrolase [unclassified Rhodococcus (in: high G+C Gram-positive bacteria)]|uniref:HAD family hydrolase n=1 Tax=unclassified Rhodococcus (in: high G+C Gram-positive bacteria) TaxID=192944 RepID=UPI001582E3CF|nr:HAD family phosphatase [Rhodococcus sp. W8901]QKT10741.1 HAD family phosphatase [Rhodococcus sp. W8901]
MSPDTLPGAPAAVLFDMDGTLVDTERLWWDAVEQVAARLGRPLSDADAPAVVGRPADHTAAHLCRALGPAAPDPDALARELDEAFAALVANDVVPRPGVLSLLDELVRARIPTAIVTASPRRVVDVVRETLGATRFTTTIAVEDTVCSKPAPDPYLAAAAALGVDPRACVAVEDTPVGVAAAEAAGCAVLVVPSVAVPPAAGRTILDSLEGADVAFLASLLHSVERY